MSEFKFVPGRGIVRVVEEVVGDDAEAQLQAELDAAQNLVNERTEQHNQRVMEWEELEKLSAAKSEEVEGAKVALNAATEDLKSAVEGRDSLTAARAQLEEVAGSDPAQAAEEVEQDGVAIPVKVADEAAV